MTHGVGRGRAWPAICVLAAAAVLGGCSNVLKGERTTRIDSDPAGATVLASGAEIGVTPLTIQPDEVFPPHFVGMEYRSSGTLAFEKPGCKTYRQKVNDGVLSQDIHVKLTCDPDYKPAPAAATAPTAPPMSKAAGAERASIAARLRRLDGLRQQGLISADEYQQIRKKILNEL